MIFGLKEAQRNKFETKKHSETQVKAKQVVISTSEKQISKPEKAEVQNEQKQQLQVYMNLNEQPNSDLNHRHTIAALLLMTDLGINHTL